MQRSPRARDQQDTRTPSGSTLLTALVILVAAGFWAKANAQTRPNVILFIADDLAYGALPYYNPPIDFDSDSPHTNSALGLRSPTHNRLDARLLAAPDLQETPPQDSGQLGTFQPPTTYTPAPPGTGGTSPWASYTVCAWDARLHLPAGDYCDPNFEYNFAYEGDPPDPTMDVLPGHGGLQQLATKGVVFTRAYATAGVCLPTRASIMTGKHGQRTGANANDTDGRIGIDEITLPRLLKQTPVGPDPQALAAKYRTALVGKWHVTTLNAELNVEPHAHFDEAIYSNVPYRSYFQTGLNAPLECDGDLCTTDPVWKWWSGNGDPDVTSGSETLCNNNPTIVENVHSVGCNFSVRGYADLAVAFLQHHHATYGTNGKPFFLTVAFNAVHDGHDAPFRTNQHYAANPSPNHWGKKYWALVEEMDAAIGRILNALRKEGFDSNTVVLFTSDQGPDGAGQGPEFGDPRLSGGKATTWEGGIRVPLIARPPGGVTGPVYLNTLASHVDIYRTVAAFAGLSSHTEVTSKRDGVSLSQSILSQTESSRQVTYSRTGNFSQAGKPPPLSMIFKENMFPTTIALLEVYPPPVRHPEVPARLAGVCGYGPDPATTHAENAPCANIPATPQEKLRNCTTAARGTSYRLCRTTSECTGTLCAVDEKRCINNAVQPPQCGGIDVCSPQELQYLPRCTGAAQCDGAECRTVQVQCNQCVPALWKIQKSLDQGSDEDDHIFDVASNPGEDLAFDFNEDAAKQLYSGDTCMECVVDYLRATMRCWADKFLECEEGQQTPCETGVPLAAAPCTPPQPNSDCGCPVTTTTSTSTTLP
jgi:arylsulfatase A-like enzyme